jgi:hypothetical protein
MWYQIVAGNLLGGGDYTHYYPPTPGSADILCPSSCQAIFTTQGSGASSGLVTLTLSFANVLDDSLWNGPQLVGVYELHSRGVPAHDGIAATGVYEGVGVIQRTVLLADPVPRTLNMGDDDPRLRRRWLHGVSSEVEARIDGRLINLK